MDVADVMALLGLVAVAAGLLMVSVPLALVVVGLFLIAAARGSTIARRKPTDG